VFITNHHCFFENRKMKNALGLKAIKVTLIEGGTEKVNIIGNILVLG
jgi:hypothetical protein